MEYFMFKIACMDKQLGAEILQLSFKVYFLNVKYSTETIKQNFHAHITPLCKEVMALAFISKIAPLFLEKGVQWS